MEYIDASNPCDCNICKTRTGSANTNLYQSQNTSNSFISYVRDSDYMQMAQTMDLKNNEAEANLTHVLEKRADILKSLGDK